MIFSIAVRRLFAWCALAAMLMAALAPGVSRAVAAASSGSVFALADICTVGDDNARKAVPAVVHDAAPVSTLDVAPGHVVLHLDHCAYCYLAGEAPGVLASALIPMTAVTIVARQPLLFLQSPRTLHAWRAAQPRAPPGSLS